MACWNITLQACGSESSCPDCCDTVRPCADYSVTTITGTVDNLKVGDQLHVNLDCGEESLAEDGFFHDCPECPTSYGCITVSGGLGIISAIAQCTGSENTCGSGEAAVCEQAATLETNKQQSWGGRQKISVAALDTWETLFEYSPRYGYDPNTGTYYEEDPDMNYYLKQIWIHNCDLGETNDKKFSVRIYGGGAYITEVEGVITYNANPSEVLLADRIKLGDNERVILLSTETPLHLFPGDIIEIQAHTKINEWTISAWLEPVTQNWPQVQVSTSRKKDDAGVNSISMSGLSTKMRGGKGDSRFKPGAASTSGEGGG